MRKRLVTPTPKDAPHLDEDWLDLGRIAVVEVTSEDKDCPVESALVVGELRGWRAADSGTQTIRLIFDEPQRLARISLVFEETEAERTQEFVLRWSPDSGRSFREIVRQHWNFSPPETIREVEEYPLAPRSKSRRCLDSGARKQRENVRIECCARLLNSLPCSPAACSREPPYTLASLNILQEWNAE